MDNVLRGNSRYPNKQFFSNNVCFEIKYNGAGAFGNLIHASVNALLLFQDMKRGMTLMACKCNMAKKKNTHSKFRLE